VKNKLISTKPVSPEIAEQYDMVFQLESRTQYRETWTMVRNFNNHTDEELLKEIGGYLMPFGCDKHGDSIDIYLD